MISESRQGATVAVVFIYHLLLGRSSDVCPVLGFSAGTACCWNGDGGWGATWERGAAGREGILCNGQNPAQPHEILAENTRLFTDFGLSLIPSFLSVCCRSDHVKRGQHHSPTERFQLELSVTTKVAALLRSA